MKFAGWVITTNIFSDYIVGEIGRGRREQDTTKYSNRRQSVLPRCQTEVLTPSE